MQRRTGAHLASSETQRSRTLLCWQSRHGGLREKREETTSGPLCRCLEYVPPREGRRRRTRLPAGEAGRSRRLLPQRAQKLPPPASRTPDRSSSADRKRFSPGPQVRRSPSPEAGPQTHQGIPGPERQKRGTWRGRPFRGFGRRNPASLFPSVFWPQNSFHLEIMDRI